MALKKASLACAVCGSRNYSIKISGNPKPTRLEVNKFCKHCGKYTTHRETRQERAMRFIGDIFRLLKDTTWPTRKESWRDFRSIMEYTAFFVVIIYIFDQLIVSGLIRFINIFQKVSGVNYTRNLLFMKGNIMDSFDKGWFVLQTYSGYENKVKENLLQRAQTYNMLDNILRVEIPTQTVQVEKNGKRKEVEENRFPGYVLVEMVMTDEAWFVVRNTPNVTGFVGSHGNRSKPTPLLEQEIRDILVSMGQTVQEFDIDVEVGQTVRIIDGAFADYTGKITEIDNNKVKMIISMFGNGTFHPFCPLYLLNCTKKRGLASLWVIILRFGLGLLLQLCHYQTQR